MPPLPDRKTLAALVKEVARQELLPRFACAEGSRKADGSLVCDADLGVQQRLAAELGRRWPDFVLLSEELPEQEQRQALEHAATGVWCLDPLDGTSNFIAGVPYYALSLGLIVDDQVKLAVVHDPSRDECFSAEAGQGAWLNDEPLPFSQTSPVSLSCGLALVDLKRLPADLAGRLASEPPYKSQRSFGAVALDWCWLAAGRCQVYLHGRQKLWDYAAGSLILRESGGQAVTLEGEPVFRPTLTPRSTAAALDPELFRQWCEWLGIPLSHTGQSG